MPVTFAPAQPMSTPIAQGYGATEQFDKTLPILAGLYESAGRNQVSRQNAELAADVHNQTVSAELASREGNVRDSLAAHARFEQQQMQQQRQLQDRQIEAQQQAQYMNWAMHDSAVTQQEVLHQQRQQQGLAQLVQMTQDGSFDMRNPETRQMVMDATAELKTGINFAQRRQQEAQEKERQAHAKALMEKAGLDNAVLRKNLEIQGKSATDNAQLDPQAELLERDKLRPKYQALAAVIGADAAQQAMDKEVRDNVIRGGHYKDIIGISSHGTAEYRDMTKSESAKAAHAKAEAPQIPGEAGTFTTKAGGFDYAAAKKDATARAEADPAFLNQETGKLNAEGHQWVKARADGLEREWRQAKAAQGRQPDQQPSGPASDPALAFQSAVEQNPKLDGLAKSQAVDTYQKAVQLAQKPGRTPEETRLLRDMLEYLEKVQGK